MDNVSTKQHKLLISLVQLLLAENQSLRYSMNQVDSLLKHAMALLNENECYVHMALQNKMINLKNRSIYNQNPTNEVEDETVLRLNRMLNNATQLFQAEDIVSQIVQRVIARSLVIDGTLHDMSHMPLDEHLLEQFIQKNMEYIQELNQDDHLNSIKQSNLHPGEIELFIDKK